MLGEISKKAGISISFSSKQSWISLYLSLFPSPSLPFFHSLPVPPSYISSAPDDFDLEVEIISTDWNHNHWWTRSQCFCDISLTLPWFPKTPLTNRESESNRESQVVKTFLTDRGLFLIIQPPWKGGEIFKFCHIFANLCLIFKFGLDEVSDHPCPGF